MYMAYSWAVLLQDTSSSWTRTCMTAPPSSCRCPAAPTCSSPNRPAPRRHRRPSTTTTTPPPSTCRCSTTASSCCPASASSRGPAPAAAAAAELQGTAAAKPARPTVGEGRRARRREPSRPGRSRRKTERRAGKLAATRNDRQHVYMSYL